MQKEKQRLCCCVGASVFPFPGLSFCLSIILIAIVGCNSEPSRSDAPDVVRSDRLQFDEMPPLPDAIGMAGPIVGVAGEALIVAGGANFEPGPQLWESPKRYHTQIWVLDRIQKNGDRSYRWNERVEGKLSTPVAYSSSVSTPQGIVSLGGENEDGLTNRALLLQPVRTKDGGWKVVENDRAVPDLPEPCSAGGAAIVDGYIYMVAGQIEVRPGVRAASRKVWRLDIASIDPDRDENELSSQSPWQVVVSWPNEGPRRMFPQVTVQHDGFGDRLYVIGGRRFVEDSSPVDLKNLQASADGWCLNPNLLTGMASPDLGSSEVQRNPWRRIADAPVPLTAGTAVACGPAHIIVPGAATMEIVHHVADAGIEMKDFDHPGFPRATYAYHTITDTWMSVGQNEGTQVTTPAVRWGDEIFLVSGEIMPRVRTNQVWRISVRALEQKFGAVNGCVVVLYLLSMLALGVFFTSRNRSTDDYFRGGKQVPWWAAGCSIFATMLSSITYMAVPAKAFAQDWVYAVGSLLILGVAPIAVFVALPFFRQMDVTSAYEYLEQRFNRTARQIGSGSFTLFHVFRMGVVLALAALALSSVTPWTPSQCVLVMGGLSIIYCTLGGVEAVIWTDTVQTFVLIGGAMLCFVFAWYGAAPGSLSMAVNAGKLDVVQLDWGATSYTTMALWVVVLGGFGQNLASYTSDQAVVQRYMTTADQNRAGRAIWLNGGLAVPAALLFFGMGTAFWMFYRSHPEKLDPTMAADRIMPLFISQELPVGLAGLVIAGIFAAAQSTVSTSMNSAATTIVTDFLRPARCVQTERGYLNLARIATLAMGIVGTLTGLLFVDPEIKSLFDQFIGVLGMFLGVLAGLFALGATTRRANSTGSLIGALVAMVVMTAIVLAAKEKVFLGLNVRAMFDHWGWGIYRVSSYLYAFVGISVCYVVGYAVSLVTPPHHRDLAGLTLWDRSAGRDRARASQEPTRSA